MTRRFTVNTVTKNYP